MLYHSSTCAVDVNLFNDRPWYIVVKVPGLLNIWLISCEQKLDFLAITRALIWELSVRAAVIGWCHLRCPEEVSHCKIWSLAPSLLLYPCAHDISLFFSRTGPVIDMAALPILRDGYSRFISWKFTQSDIGFQMRTPGVSDVATNGNPHGEDYGHYSSSCGPLSKGKITAQI
jgi:hypothetical protein